MSRSCARWRSVCSIFLLLCLSVAPAAADGPDRGKMCEQVSCFAQYRVPEGWTESEKMEPGEAQVILRRDLHEIKIRFTGGEKSRYRTIAEFIDGFDSRSYGGKIADKLGEVMVANRKTFLYQRKIVAKGNPQPLPDESGPVLLTTEEFCLVKAGERFFILSYSYSDSIPDPHYNGETVWRDFLKSFKLKKNNKENESQYANDWKEDREMKLFIRLT